MGSAKRSPPWKVAALLLPAAAIVAMVIIFIVGVVKAVMSPGPQAPAREQVVLSGERDAGRP